MSHEFHIYATASDMTMDTICAYPPYQNPFPHWKCVLRCFSNCACIDLPVQELDRHHSNIYPSISFHIHHLIAQCIMHVRRPLDEKNIFRLCLQYPASMPPSKIYTIKYIFMMETYISDFHTSFYIQ